MNSPTELQYSVPFYSNTPDDTHCFQVALRMVLKFFYPEEEYSWQELDEITAKGRDLWTWPTAGLVWLKKKGLEVKVISPFDYESFIAEGGDFLIKKYGKEVGEAQIKHSHIDQERTLAAELLETMPIEKRIPEPEEIFDMLKQGYLVICNVNSQLLNNKQGYTGHFVVITGFTDGQLLLHDPGLPPQKNRLVSLSDFDAAWSFPNQEAREIYAFRK